jgi:hypothetical protein
MWGQAAPGPPGTRPGHARMQAGWQDAKPGGSPQLAACAKLHSLRASKVGRPAAGQRPAHALPARLRARAWRTEGVPLKRDLHKTTLIVCGAPRLGTGASVRFHTGTFSGADRDSFRAPCGTEHAHAGTRLGSHVYLNCAPRSGPSDSPMSPGPAPQNQRGRARVLPRVVRRRKGLRRATADARGEGGAALRCKQRTAPLSSGIISAVHFILATCIAPGLQQARLHRPVLPTASVSSPRSYSHNA